MKKLTTKKFPKKAKLITDGGFYKIINIEARRPKICFPLMKNITLVSPETNVFDMSINFIVEFIFTRVYKGYAEYNQYNVTTSVAK